MNKTQNKDTNVYILKLYSKYDYEINEILGIYTTEEKAIEQQNFFKKTIKVEEFETVVITQKLNNVLEKKYLEKYYLY